MEEVLCSNRGFSKCSGYILLLMLLVIVVVGTLIWLDPSALIRKRNPDLSWNEEYRLLKPDEALKERPSSEQADITEPLEY